MTLTESGLRSTHVVHAILVTHNGARWLPGVAQALGALTRPPDSIIAVDTGSQDRSRDLVSGLAKTVLIAERDEGFGDAVALGVEHLPPSQPGIIEWIWLLHDDFAPAPDALERMLVALDDAPGVGIAGPKLRGWADKAHLLEAGISIAANGARWTGLDRRERDQGQHDEHRDVLSVSTAGMLIRRDVWEELEGLDPNISLFRDDVDLGWRANVAGHRVLCVTDAVGYHAEAAATERRRVDVAGALHRPHLLDRRHAAYVLLANCSPSRFPIVFLRLVLSSSVRAIGYLIAKLPGYAIDEVGGLLLLISRPDLLRQARRARRARRLLPARTVRPLLAPFGSQARAAIEGVRSLILRGLDPLLEPVAPAAVVLSDDEEDQPAPEEPLLRRIIARPGVALILGLSLVALIASRGRWGSLSGGALLPAPPGALDLWTFYIQSWHEVGLGSSTPSPAWVPLIALGSAITAGNVPLFVTALFALSVPVAGAIMYALLRPRVQRHLIAAIGAAAYALCPALLAATHGGHLGTLVVALVLPILIRIAEPLLSFAGLLAASWRRIFVITALAGIVVAFSPVLLLVLALSSLAWIGIHPLERWAYPRVLFPSVGAFVLNMPWSLSALAHPVRWLSEPGLALPGSRPLQLLLLNPGGPGSPPVWIGGVLTIAGLLLVGTSARWSRDWMLALAGIASLMIALVIASFPVAAASGGRDNTTWAGGLIVFATAVFVMIAIERSEQILESLSKSGVGILHATTAVIVVAQLFSIALASLWFITAPAQVRADQEGVLPAFVAELSSTSDQARTLVLDASRAQVRIGVLRGRELLMGEADVLSAYPEEFLATVGNLLAGGTQNTSERLGRYGIGFVLMKEPVDQDLARTLDGVGGLQRLSVTDGRILWSVATTTTRVRIIDADGVTSPVADARGLSFTAAVPGTLLLSEKADRAWRATSNGQRLQSVDRGDGLQAFELPKSGPVVISHDAPGKRAALALAVLSALTLVFLIAPSGRRLRERPDEEVA